MKITNLAIAFVLIVAPFYFVLDLRASALSKVNYLEDQYDTALKTASQDAAVLLNINEYQEYEAGYQSNKFFNANKELAIDAFFRSLYLNFNIENDPISQGAFSSYVPAVVVTDYDGYWIYALTEYSNSQGEIAYKHMWRPKKPYAFTDQQGNVFNFTLDGYVRVHDVSTRTWIKGWQQDLAGRYNIPLLNDKAAFEAQRRTIIVDSIQQDLAFVINKHNEFVSKYGISYSFSLPYIPKEDWVNTIDDIGVIAFIQGIPIGDRYYNNYAFGGGRLVKKPVIYGSVDQQTGIRYYYRDSCSYPYRIEEAFSSEKEAAAAGYFPKECFNGSP
ncbi:hypothetical protein RB298_04900 [Priestia sp. BR_2]